MYYAIEENNEIICERETKESVINAAENYYLNQSYENSEYGIGEIDVFLNYYKEDGELVSSKTITLTWNATNEPSEFQQHNVWGL